jgi:hypothetical protein
MHMGRAKGCGLWGNNTVASGLGLARRWHVTWLVRTAQHWDLATASESEVNAGLLKYAVRRAAMHAQPPQGAYKRLDVGGLDSPSPAWVCKR